MLDAYQLLAAARSQLKKVIAEFNERMELKPSPTFEVVLAAAKRTLAICGVRHDAPPFV